MTTAMSTPMTTDTMPIAHATITEHGAHSGLIGVIKGALEKSLSYTGKLDASVLSIEGMSGKKYRYFINNVIESLDDARYLEVGSWAGSTLCAAIHGNAVTALAIDNWSQFGGPVQHFFHNVAMHSSLRTKVSVLTADFRSVNFASLGKFNVYLFDGPHEYADQYDGLMLAMDALDDEFIFIVDDWNWEAVRTGTFDAIKNSGLEIVFKVEIRTTLDNSHAPGGQFSFKNSDWHNGYFISVLRKRAPHRA